MKQLFCCVFRSLFSQFMKGLGECRGEAAKPELQCGMPGKNATAKSTNTLKKLNEIKTECLGDYTYAIELLN